MEYLKQSTAATVKLGPFLDDTDGKTAETALTIAQADIRLSKNGGAFAQTNNATGATHDELGWYGIPFNTTDTGTLGRLRVAVHESGALPCFAEYMVLPANVYDSLCSTDKLQVDVIQLLDTAWLSPAVAGTPDVNAKQLGGTTQTGRDVGTSVLLSSGSGAGQLDFTSGVVKSNLAQILGTALTETAGWIAAGFKKLFNVATPLLVASDVMRGTDSANTTTPPTAAAIVNEWETQSQADPTGFHVNTREWLDQPVTLSTGNKPDVNIDEISDDATAPGNLELMYDGTGYVGGTAKLDVNVASEANIDFGTTKKTSIETAVNNKLVAQKLDHLVAVADADDVVDNSIIAKMSTKGATADWSTFVNTSDSLEAIRDRGDAEWTTGAGGSAPTVGEIRTEMEGTGTKLTLALEDTNELQTNQGAWVTATTVALNAQGKLDVNAECDSALTDYDLPTRTEATTDKDAIITEVNANETKIDLLQIDSTAIKVKTDNLPSGISKNVLLNNFEFLMVLSSDHISPATGKTVDCQRSIDGEAFANCNSATATEVSAGIYKLDLAASDLNGDIITLKFSEATCDTAIITIKTDS